uniref:Uncharacterized protein n=2 Tax=Canis lupus TaxID=9612 RepID=A0A8C0P805_CANLF
MSFQCFHLNCSCNIFAQKGLRKKTTSVEEKYNLVLFLKCPLWKLWG